MSAGYTFTTITGGPGEPVKIGVSFHPGDGTRIRVYGRGTGCPQLGIAHGDVEAMILPTPGRITESDARLARELASQAAAYAAEVERLHAEHQA